VSECVLWNLFVGLLRQSLIAVSECYVRDRMITLVTVEYRLKMLRGM